MIVLGTNFGILGLALSYLIANSADAGYLSISNYILNKQKNKSTFNK